MFELLRKLGIALLGGALLSQTACYRSTLGMRGMAGLGEVMVQSPTATAEVERRPQRVIDAHSYFENGNDEVAMQPSWGMELAYRGANVVGGTVMHRNGRFYPKVEPKAAFKFVICGEWTGSDGRMLRDGLGSGRFKCVHIESAQGKFLQEERSHGAIKVAAKHNAPVILDYTPSSYSSKDSAIPDWENVLQKYPKTNFIIAHLGFPWVSEAAALLAKYSNAYADTALVLEGAILENTDKEVANWIAEQLVPFAKLHKKVLFGSAWPRSTINGHVTGVMQAYPKDLWEWLFLKNSDTLFKMGLTEERMLGSSLLNGRLQLRNDNY